MIRFVFAMKVRGGDGKRRFAQGRR
jgi:hypothetical protein